MKKYLHAFVMCQSMFCAIPAPQAWDEKAKDKMLLFLPVVGLEIGLIWAAIAWACNRLNLPVMVTALILAAYPYIVTGFLHLDGFMDVTDAVKSCRDLTRRREILKDSHVGSFAVIGCILLMLAQFVSAACLPREGRGWLLLLLPAVSRFGSSLAVTLLRPMSTSQYAAQQVPKFHGYVLGGGVLLAVALGFCCGWKVGAALLAAAVGYALALRKGYRSLEGMNGDIAGYALTLSELWGIAAFALLG